MRRKSFAFTRGTGTSRCSSRPARAICVCAAYHGLSYDALIAYVAFVFTRYMMMLSVAKQSDEDMRTIGELFYVMVGEVADMTFRQAMMILQEAMLASIKTVFHMTEEQIQAVAQDFADRLPKYMRGVLQKSVA